MKRAVNPWRNPFISWFLILTGILSLPTGRTSGQEQPRASRPRWVTRRDVQPAGKQVPQHERQVEGSLETDLEIAAQFAPIIHQGLNGNPRFDYITNFDFDGDWQGDDNWDNAENKSYPLRAYVYYSVIETDTHYYVHYAVFHPRDYKGGLFQSWLLAEAVRQAQERLKGNIPSEAEDLVLSHENDMEGCLVVAEKRGPNLQDALVAFVETMAHNEFNQYRPPNEPTSIGYVIEVEDTHPVLFCEPKGHGILGYTGRSNQLKDATRGVLIYRYTGEPEDPEHIQGKEIGYRLIPMYGTLWQRARANASEMYGEAFDYGAFAIDLAEGESKVTRERAVGKIGSAFLGKVGAANKARPPWGWYDYRDRQGRPGAWFFDPASTIKRHFYASGLSTTYVYHPYLDVWRESSP